MDKLVRILVSAKMGEVIAYEGVNLKTTLSKYACRKCAFETEEKASGCKFKNSCMAHLRKDRQSVVFANATTK